MTWEKFQDIIADIHYKNWTLRTFDNWDGFSLQWTFMEKDATKPEDGTLHEQFCRKWLVSKYSTVTEVIRTAWLAAQQAEMHEAAECFTYKDSRLFDPHTDYTVLAEYMRTAPQDARNNEV